MSVSFSCSKGSQVKHSTELESQLQMKVLSYNRLGGVI